VTGVGTSDGPVDEPDVAVFTVDFRVVPPVFDVPEATCACGTTVGCRTIAFFTVAVGVESTPVGVAAGAAGGVGPGLPESTVVAVAAPPTQTTSIVTATSTVRALARGKKRLIPLRVSRDPI
jgi:hypothetical protein